jgi:ubiquinone biosynthesis protein
MDERWSVRAIVKDVRKHLPDMVQALQQLPPLVENAIQRAHDGRFRAPLTTQDFERLRLEIRRDGRRRDVALLTATCALGGIIWLALATAPVWPGYALLGVSVIGLWLLRR